MPTERYDSPDAETIERVVREGQRDGAMVTCLAECEVEYDGRSGGYLAPGDRLVVAKPDGTLLVHRPSGHQPVNWMPAGATIKVEEDGGAPLLYARRSNPNEYLRVYLHEPYLLTRFDADDPATYQERGTEAEMHEYIERNPETAIEEGFRVVEHERESVYGYIDFFGKDAEGRPVVVEVKRRQATLNNVDQLKRYMELYRESREPGERDVSGSTGGANGESDGGGTRWKSDPDVRGILVAPSASDRVKRTLRDDGLEFVELSEFAVETRESSEKTLSDFL